MYVFVCLCARGTQRHTVLQGSEQNLVHKMSIGAMGMMPRADGSVDLALNATVVINNPMGRNSVVDIHAFGLDAALVGAGIGSVGEIHLPMTAVTSVDARPPEPALLPQRQLQRQGGGGGPSTRFVNVTMAAQTRLRLAGSGSLFAQLLGQFMDDSTVAVTMLVRAAAPPTALACTHGACVVSLSHTPPPQNTSVSAMRISLSCALGLLNVSVPVNLTSVVNGLSGFSNVTLGAFNVTGVVPPPGRGFAVAVDVNFVNPSPADMPLGSLVTMSVWAYGQRLGLVGASNASIVVGNNTMHLDGVLDPAPGAPLGALSRMLSNYVSGRSTPMECRGENITEAGMPVPAWLKQTVRVGCGGGGGGVGCVCVCV